MLPPFVAVSQWDFKTAILAGLRSDKYAPKKGAHKNKAGCILYAPFTYTIKFDIINLEHIE